MPLWRTLTTLRLTTDAGRLLCAVSVSTGVHVVALVGLGLLVGGDRLSRGELPAIEGGMLAGAAHDAVLDASQIVVSSDTDAAETPTPSAVSSAASLTDACVALLHRASSHSPQGGSLAAWGSSPFDDLAALGHGSASAELNEHTPPAATSGSSPEQGGKGNYFFGVPSQGERIVFVVDFSGSMHGRRFRRARNELRHSIAGLRPTQQYFIVFFSDRVLPMPATGLVTATQANVAQTFAWLGQVQCGGGTNPWPGLMIALALRPDTIYLLTDGKFEPSVVSLMSQAQPSQPIPVHTIGFASRKSEKLLQAIAEQTGGIYRYVK